MAQEGGGDSASDAGCSPLHAPGAPQLHTPRNPAPVPFPAPQPQVQHEKQPCCSLHMQPLSVTMSSSQRRLLQRRFDVLAETSLAAALARPLLLWAFRSSQWQLQAVFRPRPSLLHLTAAQSRAFSCHFGAKQRQSLLTCSRLCVTLAARLMYFQSACAVTHPLRQAACIMSRRHYLHGCLGAVAAAGAGLPLLARHR
jgi:hypothetical protein